MTFSTVPFTTGIPSEATMTSWIEQVRPVNPNFRFALKMKKTITHGGEANIDSDINDAKSSVPAAANPTSPAASGSRLKEHYSHPLHPAALAHELPLFFKRASSLPPSMRGPILFQFPPSYTCDLSSLHRLADALDMYVSRPTPTSSPQWRCALEFRHPSWFCPAVFSFLHVQEWALVLHALPKQQQHEQALAAEVARPITSSHFVYLRLHGLKEEHAWDYTREELDEYVRNIKKWREGEGESGVAGGREEEEEGEFTGGRDVYVYFLNDAEGRAPENALLMGQMVAEAMGRGEKAPRKPRAGVAITKYFGGRTNEGAEGESREDEALQRTTVGFRSERQKLGGKKRARLEACGRDFQEGEGNAGDTGGRSEERRGRVGREETVGTRSGPRDLLRSASSSELEEDTGGKKGKDEGASDATSKNMGPSTSGKGPARITQFFGPKK